MHINHFAVVTCAALSLVLGGLWYSPLLFFNIWKREAGMSDEQLKNAKPAKTYTLTFILALLMSYNLAFFLSDDKTTAMWGLIAGFLAGFGWAALLFAVISLFEQRSLRYMLINGGYMVVYLSLVGWILGAWR